MSVCLAALDWSRLTAAGIQTDAKAFEKADEEDGG